MKILHLKDWIQYIIFWIYIYICPGHFKVHVHGRDGPGRPVHGHCPVPLPALLKPISLVYTQKYAFLPFTYKTVPKFRCNNSKRENIRLIMFFNGFLDQYISIFQLPKSSSQTGFLFRISIYMEGKIWNRLINILTFSKKISKKKVYK